MRLLHPSRSRTGSQDPQSALRLCPCDEENIDRGACGADGGGGAGTSPVCVTDPGALSPDLVLFLMATAPSAAPSGPPPEAAAPEAAAVPIASSTMPSSAQAAAGSRRSPPEDAAEHLPSPSSSLAVSVHVMKPLDFSSHDVDPLAPRPHAMGSTRTSGSTHSMKAPPLETDTTKRLLGSTTSSQESLYLRCFPSLSWEDRVAGFAGCWVMASL